MKFKCTDDIERDFEDLSSYLVRKHGFDPSYLKKDGLLRLDVVGLSLLGQLRWAKNHRMLKAPSYVHYNRRHRKKCPANVVVTDFYKELAWIAVVDSFKHRKQSELESNQDSLTFISRLFFRSPDPELEALVSPSSTTTKPFATSCGYPIPNWPDTYYYSDGLYLLLAGDVETEGNLYFLNPSLLGFLDYIYVVAGD